MVQEVAQDLGQEPVSCGVMIETPRAALVAHEWVSGIDFVSFGTNDLTQLTWGLSRDDSDQITEAYAHLNITDPFESFDHQGVGLLLQASCQRLLHAKPSLRLSVCGEHAALPESAAFFKSAGIHTLSCSPFFVPRMRVACGLLGADEKR
jgi:pyruvate,orthophosphate dikinase